jgi:YD repeat-containing protein
LSRVTKTDWQYDSWNRLTQESHDSDFAGPSDAAAVVIDSAGDYVDTYTLDLSGNRLGKVRVAPWTSAGETIIYTYNERDQLITEDSTHNANDRTYTYDADGNTTQVTTNQSSTIKYVWDLRNRMTGVDSNGDGDTANAGQVLVLNHSIRSHRPIQ